MFKVLFDTKSFCIYCLKVLPFDEPIFCLWDIAHHTLTLEEFIARSMVVTRFVAAQVPQLRLFANLEI